MPRLKHFDDPSHVKFVQRFVKEDLADPPFRETPDQVVAMGVAAIRHYNPSSDAVASIVEATGWSVEAVSAINASLKTYTQIKKALFGYWFRVRRERERRERRVYFLASDRHVKTGCSRFVSERVKYLQVHDTTGHRLIGSIPGNFSVEREWHKRFAHLRSHREWFLAEPELLAAIDHALETTPGAERSDYVFQPRRDRIAPGCVDFN